MTRRASSGAATAPAVAASGVVVTFGTFHALKGVDLDVYPGEVLGLLGENGAGKSTLIKVLSGVYRASAGSIAVNGSEVDFRSPTDAVAAGIATVHQHSMLAPNLTVAANLVLGEEPRNSLGLVSRGHIRRRAQEICDSVGIQLPLDSLVSDLSLARRQLVEIVRATSKAQGLLILDEPTAALEPTEVDALFETVMHLRERGIAVLYISHRLDEIPRICDRVVVLRDGTRVGELPKEDCVPDKIVPLLAGRPIGDLFPEMTPPSDELVLTATQLSVNGADPIDLTLRRGEVLGLTGAEGAGQRAVARALAGIDSFSGSVQVDGKDLDSRDTPGAIRCGIAYVSGDRSEGVFPDETVWRNAAVGWWSRIASTGGFIRRGREKEIGDQLVREYRVRAADSSQPIATLSGGNQQKVLIARWAGTSPRVIVLDEPTLGVDVGARREIYDLVAEQVSQGTAVILVSSDHPELQAMSHRVLVFADGSPVAEMTSSEASEDAVLLARTAAARTGKEQ